MIGLVLSGVPQEMLDLSSGAFGPGWYLTDLPPQTQTAELLRYLWGGDVQRAARTEFWVSVTVPEFKLRSPSVLQPHLWFLPVSDKLRVSSEGSLFAQSLSSVVMQAAGSRRNAPNGQVSVRRHVWKSRELLPPHQFLIEGWSKLTSDRQERLLRYFGVRRRKVQRPDSQSPEAKAVDELDQLYRDGRLELGLKRAEAFTGRYPSMPDLWSNRGAFLARLERRREAVDCYIRALDLEPDYPQARINLAASLIRLGLVEQAVMCVNEILMNHPDHAEAWYNRSSALIGLRVWQSALRSCDRFLALAPGHPRAPLARSRRRYCQARRVLAWPTEQVGRLQRLVRGW